jgi:hypothetical protein
MLAENPAAYCPKFTNDDGRAIVSHWVVGFMRAAACRSQVSADYHIADAVVALKTSLRHVPCHHPHPERHAMNTPHSKNLMVSVRRANEPSKQRLARLRLCSRNSGVL